MLVRPPAAMSGSFPSFMSVYDAASKHIHNNAPSPQEQSYQSTDNDRRLTASLSNTNTDSFKVASHSLPGLVYRRGSATSDSTGSSPTTTNSTFDSPLMADNTGSPSSSPESANSNGPPKSFRPTLSSSQSMTNPSKDRHMVFPPPQSFPIQTPEDSKRNVKNLTLDVQVPAISRSPPTSGLDESTHPFSAPTSPLRDGLRMGRRKPTNLSIRTPGFNELNFGRVPSLVPPTPGRKLSQPSSSPCLSTLISPTKGPPGGMNFGISSFTSSDTRDKSADVHNEPMGTNLPSLREEEYQPPTSQETAEKGYTDGPVLIYDAGVYLYLEPTAEEACCFDTVINVAKEVKDPFDRSVNKTETVMSVWRGNSADRLTIPEPQTALSEKSFRSAFEWPAAVSPATPVASTPKVEPSTPQTKPEYLHVPWDHNSEIINDLLPLCQFIDERVTQGKKVLIHCQLGVSRSASLIIAYGLFKKYKQDFHSMYTWVKQRSQWVGPNMSLIYQLMDFLTKCSQVSFTDTVKMIKPEWIIHSDEESKTPTSAPIERTIDTASQTEQTTQDDAPPPVPSKIPVRLDKDLPPLPPIRESSDSSDPLRLPKRAASRPLPFRVKYQFDEKNMSIPPHAPSNCPGLKLTHQAPLMDLAQQDVPSTPSVFSPRATEFSATPFGITAAGDLASAGPGPKRQRPPPGAFPGGNEWRNSIRQSVDLYGDFSKLLAFDPRSPAQTSEAKEIRRNIDHML